MNRLFSLMLIVALAISCAVTNKERRESGAARSGDGADAIAGYGERWPAACKKIMSKLNARLPSANLRALPMHLPAEGSFPWRISLGSFSVGLPSDKYILKASRSGTTGGSLSIILQGAKDTVMLIKDPPSQPMQDVFGLVGQLAPGEEERRRTRRLFDRYPTIHHLAKIGYRHTPADLSCRAQNATREIPIAISLLLKTTASWAEQVFKIKGVPGHVFYGKQGARCTIEARPYDRDGDYFVTVFTTDSKRCTSLLGRIFIVKERLEQGPPWLEALGAALQNPDEQASWESLLEALIAAHAPAASKESVMNIIEQVK